MRRQTFETREAPSRSWLLLSAVMALLGGPAAAQDPATSRDEAAAAAFESDPDGILSLSFENDVIGDGEDRYYTNGLETRYLFPSAKTPWARGDGVDAVLGAAPRRLEIGLGQQIFTPEELGPTAPITDDRPYGAFLYFEGSALTLKPNQSLFGIDALAQDRLSFQIGAVGGTFSLGEFAQQTAHDIFTGAEPNGYDNGLESEPGFNLIASRTYHIYGDLVGLETEIRPTAELSLGTVTTQATAGVEFRIGRDLHFDLSRVDNRSGVAGGGFFRPKDRLSWALFTGAQGRVVGYNVFLDGNVFRDGPDPSIDIDPRVGVVDGHVGFSMAYGPARLAYAFVIRSREFDEQDEAQAFGHVTLGFRF